MGVRYEVGGTKGRLPTMGHLMTPPCQLIGNKISVWQKTILWNIQGIKASAQSIKIQI